MKIVKLDSNFAVPPEQKLKSKEICESGDQYGRKTLSEKT